MNKLRSLHSDARERCGTAMNTTQKGLSSRKNPNNYIFFSRKNKIKRRFNELNYPHSQSREIPKRMNIEEGDYKTQLKKKIQNSSARSCLRQLISDAKSATGASIKSEYLGKVNKNEEKD